MLIDQGQLSFSPDITSPFVVFGMPFGMKEYSVIDVQVDMRKHYAYIENIFCSFAFNQYLIQYLVFRKVFSAQNADSALKEDMNNLPKWVLLTWCVFRNRHELMNL